MTTRHLWPREAKQLNVDGLRRDVKACKACGIERTRNMTTKTLFVYRRRGTREWKGYRAGYVPDCVPVQS